MCRIRVQLNSINALLDGYQVLIHDLASLVKAVYHYFKSLPREARSGGGRQTKVRSHENDGDVCLDVRASSVRSKDALMVGRSLAVAGPDA